MSKATLKLKELDFIFITNATTTGQVHDFVQSCGDTFLELFEIDHRSQRPIIRSKKTGEEINKPNTVLFRVDNDTIKLSDNFYFSLEKHWFDIFFTTEEINEPIIAK